MTRVLALLVIAPMLGGCATMAAGAIGGALVYGGIKASDHRAHERDFRIWCKKSGYSQPACIEMLRR